MTKPNLHAPLLAEAVLSITQRIGTKVTAPIFGALAGALVAHVLTKKDK